MNEGRPRRVPAGRPGRPRQPRRPLRAVPDPDVVRQKYRGRKRDALLLDLAMYPDLAEVATRERLDLQDLEAFAQEHEQEITAIREAMVSNTSIDMAGLWVADKRKRVAEFQATIEDIDQTIQELRAEGSPWSRSHRDMERIKLDLYRQVADELGAYPQRTAAPARQGQNVHYVIESEDTEALS